MEGEEALLAATNIMKGIFYDPAARRLHAVCSGAADPGWAFVTHDLEASDHRCRRILRELLPCDELLQIDFSRRAQRRTA